MGNFGRIQIVGGLSDSVAANGKRYKLNRTLDDGRVVPVTIFDNMEDMQFALDLVDEETGKNVYASDPAFRESVREIVANSPKFMAEPTLARRSAIPTQNDFLQALKVDALRQKREQLSMEAGGSDAIAKYNAALQLIDPELEEAFSEMQAATESPTPFADYMKARKQAGLGPMRTFDIEEAMNQQDQGPTSSEPIIEIGENQS